MNTIATHLSFRTYCRIHQLNDRKWLKTHPHRSDRAEGVLARSDDRTYPQGT